MVKGTIPTYLQVFFERHGWAKVRYEFWGYDSYVSTSHFQEEGLSIRSVPVQGVRFLRIYKFFFERHGWAKVQYQFLVSFLRFNNSFSRGMADHMIGTNSGYCFYISTDTFVKGISIYLLSGTISTVKGMVLMFLQVIFKRKGGAYNWYQLRVSFLRSNKFFSRAMAELKFGTSSVYRSYVSTDNFVKWVSIFFVFRYHFNG